MNSPQSQRGRAEAAAQSASLKRAMRHDGGHLGNLHGRPANPNKPQLPSTAQRRAVNAWATANLAERSPYELTTAAKLLTTHPDAASEGYSQAKAALQRVQAELARRATN